MSVGQHTSFFYKFYFKKTLCLYETCLSMQRVAHTLHFTNNICPKKENIINTRTYFFFISVVNTVHVVELLNYYTNYCTYIKFIEFTH